MADQKQSSYPNKHIDTFTSTTMTETPSLSPTLLAATSTSATMTETPSLSPTLLAATSPSATMTETPSLSPTLLAATSTSATMTETPSLSPTLLAATSTSATMTETPSLSPTLLAATSTSATMTETPSLSPNLLAATSTDLVNASLINADIIQEPMRLTTSAETSSSLLPTSAMAGMKLLEIEVNLVNTVTTHRDNEDTQVAASVVLRSDPHCREQQAAQYKSDLETCKQEEADVTISDQAVGTFSEQASEIISEEKSRSQPAKETDAVPIDFDAQVLDISKMDAMQFFQEQEKSLQESFLSLPHKIFKKQGSPIPKSQHAAGMEHLNSLICLMEKLTSLKDENSKLRKRCDYLESTKTLLQTKRSLLCKDSHSSLAFITPPSHRKLFYTTHYPHRHDKTSLKTVIISLPRRHNGLSRRRTSSNPEELEHLELADSSSDQESRKAKSSMRRRSLSAGSSESRLKRGTEAVEIDKTNRFKGQSRYNFSKYKSKSSKWKRVKKVFTGQKLYEDIGTTIRNIRDQARSHPEHHSTRSPRSRRSEYENSVNSTDDLCGDKTTSINLSSAETNRTLHKDQTEDDPDLTSDIWMGPPDWWAEYEARKKGARSSVSSDASSIIEITTTYLRSKPVTTIPTIETPSTTITSQEKHLPNAEVSLPDQFAINPNVKEANQDGDISKDWLLSETYTKFLHKSSSCKSIDLDNTTNSDQSKEEIKSTKKQHKSAWNRVKDIIHTRKDSIKRKLRRDKPGTESEEIYQDETAVSSDELTHSNFLQDGFLTRRTPKSSPLAARQQKTSESPLGTQKGVTKMHLSKSSNPESSHGNVNIAALLAGNISGEFSEKMREWEQLRNKSKFSSVRDDSDLGHLDISKMPPEFPVRTIDLRDLKGKVPDSASEGVNTEESNTSMEVLGAPSVSVDDILLPKSGGFSLKTQANKQQAKLDKEKRRARKQQARALEYGEKLEKLNGRVYQKGDVANCHDAHNPLTGRCSNSLSTQQQVKDSHEGGNSAQEEETSSGSPGLTQPFIDSADDTSTAETNSEGSLEEMEDEACTTATQICLTKSNIATNAQIAPAKNPQICDKMDSNNSDCCPDEDTSDS